MEIQICEIEGCTKKVSVKNFCKSCYKRNFLINSIDSYDKKKAKSMENKVLCIAKTKKGVACTKQQAEGCGEFCKVHFESEKKEASVEPEEHKVKCKGFTAKQTPCLRYEAFNCDGYCVQHYNTKKKEEILEEKLNKLKI